MRTVQYIKRLSGETALLPGDRIVKILQTEKELVGTGTSFIYVYVVLVERDEPPSAAPSVVADE